MLIPKEILLRGHPEILELYEIAALRTYHPLAKEVTECIDDLCTTFGKIAHERDVDDIDEIPWHPADHAEKILFMKALAGVETNIEEISEELLTIPLRH